MLLAAEKEYNMIYNEEKRDLFKVSADYCLAHCISADFDMGKGIVVQFNRRFKIKSRLMAEKPGYTWQGPDCIVIDRVFNLITKKKYWGKPTLGTLTNAVEKMKEYAVKHGIKKIAMPIIGCGLDGLQWSEVSLMIQRIFQDTDIEILVCKQ